jgi:hypothetical protein
MIHVPAICVVDCVPDLDGWPCAGSSRVDLRAIPAEEVTVGAQRPGISLKSS